MYVSPWMQACLMPRAWDVCGCIVPPLSLWHAYILRTSGNPYLCGGDPTPDAAAEVLMYAVGGVDHGRKLYQRPNYRNRTRKSIVRAIARSKWADTHAALSEYVSESLRTPGHKTRKQEANEPKASTVAAPVEWIMAEYLAKGDAAKLDAAFDTAYVVACCMFDARRNIAGEDDTIISEEDERRIDAKLEGAA